MSTPDHDPTDRLLRENRWAAEDVEEDEPPQLRLRGMPGFVRTQVEINKAVVERLDAIQGDVNSLKDDMGVIKGWQTELAVERRVGDIFSRLCNGELLRVYPVGELSHYINRSRQNGSFTRIELERARSVDFLLEGTDSNGAPIVYAVEVSYTAGSDDINRAAQKADLVARLLGRQVKPAVVGVDFTEQFETEADLRNVAYTYIRNGNSIKR